jgi:hypothetical protein
MSISTKIVSGAAAVGLLGCGVRHDTRPPTVEEQVVIDQVLVNRERVQPTVDFLVRASNQDFFDEHGSTIDADAFIIGLHERGERLQQYNDTGRILMMTDLGYEVQGHEVYATHQDALVKKNDVLTLNPERLTPFSVSNFEHEIAHEDWEVVFGPGGHSKEVIDAVVNEDDAIEMAWTKNDFAYESDFLFRITDDLLLYAGDFEWYRGSMVAMVKDGTKTSAEAISWYTDHMYVDEEDWIENNPVVGSESGTNEYRTHIQDFFGWTPEIMQASLREGDLYETVNEYQQWNLTELTRELAEYNEARLEMQRGELHAETRYEGDQGRR